ncbi:MAG: response regulator transcription factor [Proteobacteria bacterium]|jgi:DNA-binding response OmpR family regulator|nr:response regulator transcription factor [Pseudomonadota bacterium]MDA0929535.1 response regulator transcription factor [Pseudomonadota bacterium]
MKVLVVEDNRDIAANIADYLEPQGFVLDFAADGLEGFRLLKEESFDAIVLDVMLPGMDGFSLCHKLREELQLSTPVIMLTARDQLEDKLAGFEAGVDDYLVKPFSVKELEARLKAMGKRGSADSHSQELQVGDLHFNSTTLKAVRGDKELELNPIQRKLLEFLMRNTNRVVLRSELERLIWKDDLPDGDVLRSHIYSLRNIIDKPFPERLLHTIHGSGYRLAETGQDQAH